MHFIIVSVIFFGLALGAPQEPVSYEVVVEPKPYAEGEFVAEPEMKIKPYTDAEAYPEAEYAPKPDVEVKPYTEAVSYTEAYPEAAPYTEAEIVAKPAIEIKPYIEAVSYTEAESYTTAAPYTEADVVVEPEIEVKPEDKALHKETVILNTGKKLSEALTAKIVGPRVLFNSKLAAAAGALPPMLAAKGAIIGSAIATPIEIGAVAGSGIVSGVTGKLVAIPISVGAGALAKIVSAADTGKHFLEVQSASGKQIWDFNVAHGGQVLKNGLIKIGHVLLKPVAIVVGAQTALTGAGLGIAGTGVKGVGVGMEAVGAKLVASGMLAKGVGHRLIVKNFPPYLK